MTLLSFLDASPTPFHTAANVAARLEVEGGFRVVSERDPFPTTAGRYAASAPPLSASPAAARRASVAA